MAQFEVNVRAIVTATRTSKEAEAEIPDWDVYDFDALERDGSGDITKARVRCDQLVKVSADHQEEAIENAKADASEIDIKGFEVDDVELWVDEGIDVTLADAVPGSTM